MKLRPRAPTITDVEILHGHLFCGLGGGAKGFNRGSARVGNLRTRFRCVGGIDNDAAAIADFSRAAGVPGTVRDLFSREQYEAFHGVAPPPGWREATPADIHNDFGGERPHIIFLSAPCKGFSGLLAESKSLTAKYQALNGLTLRGVWLALEAYKDDPVELFVFENVPRIAKRGRKLLDSIVALFRAYGYIVAETTHDCGELGGLGQSRKRFLLVARHREKVPNFLYEPEKKSLRGVGEIIGRFPMPGSDLVLPMHRMPSLQWKTWVRLAFVEAGADWRSLNKLSVKDGFLADYAIEPDTDWRGGVLGVRGWDQPSGVVAGENSPTNGAFSVADPRVEGGPHHTVLGVNAWDREAATVRGAHRPQNGRCSVADPRPPADADRGAFGVGDWMDPAATLTSQRSPGQGRFSVADPRVDGHEKSVQMGVGPWEQTSATIKGDVSVGTGRYAVADPRYRWAGAHENKMAVQGWVGRSKTVTGSDRVGSGALSVADPRIAGRPRFNNVYRIVPFGSPAPAVAGPGGPAGGVAVADPRQAERLDYKQTKYRITGFDEASGAVISASTTGNGAFAVADPRPDGMKGEGEAYAAAGNYGVVPWDRHANAVPSSAKHDNGFNSVADPRDGAGIVIPFVLPQPNDRLVCFIRARDGTWHRPFTTLELAALQSLISDPEEYLILEGLSDSAWRERIGNAVPPDAAESMASVMGQALLGAWSGHTFMLSSAPIWVRNVAVGLSVMQLEELAA